MTKQQFKRKIKLIEKFADAGYDSAEKFLSLTVGDISSKFPDFSNNDYKLFFDLQDSVKSGKLYSFLCS